MVKSSKASYNDKENTEFMSGDCLEVIIKDYKIIQMHEPQNCCKP